MSAALAPGSLLPLPSGRFRGWFVVVAAIETGDGISAPIARLRSLNVATAHTSAWPDPQLLGLRPSAVLADELAVAVSALDRPRRELMAFVARAMAAPDALASSGLPAPLGALVHGLPGVGKSFLLESFARRVWGQSRPWFKVSAPALFQTMQGATERLVSSLFATAVATAPSLLIIDELQELGAPLSSGADTIEARVLAQLLLELDRLTASPAGRMVLVVGITSAPLTALEPRLRTLGRLDTVIHVAPPTRAERGAIIDTLLGELEPLPQLVVAHGLEHVSAALLSASHGYVPADLAAAVRALAAADAAGEAADAASAVALALAAANVRPSLLVSGVGQLVEASALPGFDSLAGVDEEEAQLRASLVLPFAQPDAFAAAGIKPPSGILLVGPSGGGKSALVRAAAAAARVNLVVVTASDVVSKVVGETVARIAAVFETAAAAAPCVLFFDNLENVAPRRAALHGGAPGDTPVHIDRMLAALLIEMDGAVARRSSGERVVVVATAHSTDALDTAVLRPGRLDVHIPVGPRTPAQLWAVFCLALSRIVVDFDPSILDDNTAVFAAIANLGTPASVLDAVRTAAMTALREDLNTTSVSSFTNAHIPRLPLGLARLRLAPEAQLTELGLALLVGRLSSSLRLLDLSATGSAFSPDALALLSASVGLRELYLPPLVLGSDGTGANGFGLLDALAPSLVVFSAPCAGLAPDILKSLGACTRLTRLVLGSPTTSTPLPPHADLASLVLPLSLVSITLCGWSDLEHGLVNALLTAPNVGHLELVRCGFAAPNNSATPPDSVSELVPRSVPLTLALVECSGELVLSSAIAHLRAVGSLPLRQLLPAAPLASLASLELFNLAPAKAAAVANNLPPLPALVRFAAAAPPAGAWEAEIGVPLVRGLAAAAPRLCALHLARVVVSAGDIAGPFGRSPHLTAIALSECTVTLQSSPPAQAGADASVLPRLVLSLESCKVLPGGVPAVVGLIASRPLTLFLGPNTWFRADAAADLIRKLPATLLGRLELSLAPCHTLSLDGFVSCNGCGHVDPSDGLPVLQVLEATLLSEFGARASALAAAQANTKATNTEADVMAELERWRERAEAAEASAAAARAAAASATARATDLEASLNKEMLARQVAEAAPSVNAQKAHNESEELAHGHMVRITELERDKKRLLADQIALTHSVNTASERLVLIEDILAKILAPEREASPELELEAGDRAGDCPAADADADADASDRGSGPGEELSLLPDYFGAGGLFAADSPLLTTTTSAAVSRELEACMADLSLAPPPPLMQVPGKATRGKKGKKGKKGKRRKKTKGGQQQKKGTGAKPKQAPEPKPELAKQTDAQQQLNALSLRVLGIAKELAAAAPVAATAPVFKHASRDYAASEALTLAGIEPSRLGSLDWAGFDRPDSHSGDDGHGWESADDDDDDVDAKMFFAPRRAVMPAAQLSTARRSESKAEGNDTDDGGDDDTDDFMDRGDDMLALLRQQRAARRNGGTSGTAAAEVARTDEEEIEAMMSAQLAPIKQVLREAASQPVRAPIAPSRAPAVESTHVVEPMSGAPFRRGVRLANLRPKP
ncbi:cell division cycle protein 48 [Thecamonas trahens ATCC 50062]|uniref:Cell division cycle protein 48 n=1 Tax=Thecamonas trahens ATCC 50062 TaxID=461836 RepID=A0A0L0DTD1_THETB|nr:cell division cycle protein 48 [Thecamonas trahens ATCC 50062]KNC55530.1 cell division cycle protein 48 [Thecamonas trahens ATCC 50062]|eukprot:XP_013761306.1 cell division cycle protein 48 [Thecamonas trahens ATCC 50062]